MTQPYWMKHFGVTGPTGEDEQKLAKRLELLDQEQERIMLARSAIYKQIRAVRRPAKQPSSDLAS